ncbi:hypothetical protein CC80DRAFT_560752 [Byssothecium circinans]|uniref:RRM domain-containing protein n=1 Tax=Byssothecium circinans TaxID=147558 RepID=A0A6A5U3A3_9PLEO|nr:hypothetical protein CC80DRAFT_560752 [Byssothecium circinans]
MSRHHSSPDLGPSSSPIAATDPTVYSPEVLRGHFAALGLGNAPVASSSTAVASNVVPHPTVVPVTTINGIRYTRLYPHQYPSGLFSNELDRNRRSFMSRFLKVTTLRYGALPAGADQDMEIGLIVQVMKSYVAFLKCSLYYWNGVYLRFDATDHTCEAKQILEAVAECQVEYVDSYDFARAKSMDTMAIDEFEGQIKLTVAVEPSSPQVTAPPFLVSNIGWLNSAVSALLSSFGTIAVSVHIGTDSMHFTYRIEFKSVDAANRAVASLNLDPASDGVWRWSTIEVAHWTGERAPNSPHRHHPHFDDKGLCTEFIRQESHMPRSVKNSNQHESHNRVRRERIEDGTDVRTTIMLRNIPNKLDWMSLVALLNKVCFGTFDFVYLRIDFRSCNNVGYAFVNFSDVSGMIAMLDQIEGQGWTGFKSSKCAEISYATIQGHEALVQKFRNSSVMQEAPFCRPHIFHTYEEAISKPGLSVRATGDLAHFPNPNNAMKFERSMANARIMGLFPPNGATNIAIHRGFVSDFDRGSPRDVQHIANMRQQVGPVVTTSNLNEHQRRACEEWYASQFGISQHGRVPFTHIPVILVQQFMALAGYGSAPVAPIGSQRRHH